MTLPVGVAVFRDAMDPHEELDWTIPADPILEEGETIDSYTLTVLPEAALLGLTIMSGSGRDHGLASGDTAVLFWLSVDAEEQDNPAFVAGTLLGLELTIVTTSDPARTRQRTGAVRMIQQ